MIATAEAHIRAWSVPNDQDWKLRITIRIEPFGVDETFYRVHEYQERSQTRLGVDEWRWFKWSMAGKPSVRVGEECTGVLNRMVMDHPDLSLILHLFGYSKGDATHADV